MKRFSVFIALLFAAVLFSFLSKALAADNEIYAPLLSEVYGALPSGAREACGSYENYEKGNFGEALLRLAGRAAEPARVYFHQVIRTAGSVLVVCAIFTAVRSFTDGAGAKAVLYAAVCAVCALCMENMTGALAVGRESLESLRALSGALLPALCAAQMTSGAVTSAAALYTASVFAGDTVIKAVSELMAPLTYAYCALVTAACVSENEGIGKLAKLLRAGILWALKLGAGIYTLFIAVSGVLAGRAGSAAVKAVKLASSAVPLVGGVLSDAAEAVAAGAAGARSIIGTAGIIAVISVIFLPFLKTALCCALFRLCAALSAMAGAGALSDYTEKLSDGFMLILAMCAVCSLLLTVSVFTSVTGAAGI